MAEFGLLKVNQNQGCKSAGLGSNSRVYARGLEVDSELEPEPLPWSSHEGNAQTKPGGNHVFALVTFAHVHLLHAAHCFIA